MPDVRIAKILHAVNEDTGAGYFLKLVKALNEICGFDHAFVGQVDTKEKTVTTRAYVSKGEILANVTYDLVDSPCEQILDRSYCRFSEGVADIFPKDLMLADLNIKGYVGYPLLSQAGEPIGILVLLHESPIENVDTIFDLLRYFARHCECELERMTLQKALIQTRSALDQAELVRQSILRNVSHELRTPLNAILGFCDVLKNDTLFSQAKEKTKGYLDHIHSAGHELLGTITEVMDFAAIQSGSYKAEWKKTDINILTTDVVRELELKYPDRIFSTALGEKPLLASVDVVLYGKILRNIIDNAVRFSGVETKVDVSLKEDSSRLIWATISDKGPGISATRLANIQRSFTYEQNTMTKTHSGLGIGLAYVNHASRLMGAKVNFDSVTGQGTTIAIGIPMASKASIAENSVSAISI